MNVNSYKLCYCVKHCLFMTLCIFTWVMIKFLTVSCHVLSDWSGSFVTVFVCFYHTDLTSLYTCIYVMFLFPTTKAWIRNKTTVCNCSSPLYCTVVYGLFSQFKNWSFWSLEFSAWRGNNSAWQKIERSEITGRPSVSYSD